MSHLLEKHPSLGWISATLSTASGLWAYVDHLTKLAALASVAIGIAVGIVTYRVQRKQERRLDAEHAEREARNGNGGE